MAVNYMLEIIGLDDWELTHPLPATAYKLMRKLQYLANKERFPERMNVSNGLLMSMVGCSEDSLIKARNQLIQAGLIQYKGQKKITPLYMIQYFSNNPAYNTKKTGYEQGMKHGYEQGLSAGNKHGTYIDKTLLSELSPFDAEEDENDDLQSSARVHAMVISAFSKNLGRFPTNAEADRLTLAFNDEDQPDFLIERALRIAALNGAKNPTGYALAVYSQWCYEHFETEAELDEYQYLQDCTNGKINIGLDSTSAWARLRELREQRCKRYAARKGWQEE